jgi:hypothetical protein
MNGQVELWFRFKNKYRRALSIPLNRPDDFAVFPLAWLSHVAYTICGTVGHLSLTPNGPDFNCHTTTIQPTKYFYVAQGES